MKNERKLELKKIIGLIFKVLFLIIVIPIILMSVVVMIKANKYPDKIPDILGYKPMIVLSGSMETALYTGDLVFVKIVNPDTLKKGDIIAFRNEVDTVTTHRIIDIVNKNGQEYFKTKGDNNNIEDSNLVSVEDIEGVYVFKIPKLGEALMILKEPRSLLLILLIILVIGLIWLHLADKKEKEILKKEDEQYKKEFEEYKKKQLEKTKK